MTNISALRTNQTYTHAALLIICVIGFASYFFRAALNPMNGSIIGAFNLLMHEAGHWIFGIFGQFIGILGGSLLQVLIPLSCAAAFCIQNQRALSMSNLLGIAFCLMWAGQSLTEVAHYALDAQTMALPLIGGEGVIHDWNWLLREMGLLNATQVIGASIRALAFTLLLSGLGVGLYFSITPAKSATQK